MTDVYVDSKDRVILDKYLHDEGYPSVEDWAMDSDYFLHNGEWFDRGLDDTLQGPYDLDIQLYWALEAAGYFEG